MDQKVTDPAREYKIKIGNNVRLPFDSVLKSPIVEINDHTRINGAITIRGKADCYIGKYCAFGYDVRILTTNHKTSYANIQVALHRRHGFVDLETVSRPVHIGNNVWVGDGATILSGVQIGDGAIVGAGAVVNRNVECFQVVYGVPAEPGRFRFPETIRQQLLDLSWWEWSEDKIGRNKAFFCTDLAEFTGQLTSLIID